VDYIIPAPIVRLCLCVRDEILAEGIEVLHLDPLVLYRVSFTKLSQILPCLPSQQVAQTFTPWKLADSILKLSYHQGIKPVSRR
jgi:hypothetical protein